MSNILAVTADLKRCSIAVKFEGQLFEINKNVNAPTYLVNLAQDLFMCNKIDLERIDRVITASGPGSFTGIRTAQSFVNGLSLALNIPAVSVSYFQIIKNLFEKNFGQRNDLVSIIQSEKKQVYFHDFSTGNFGVCPYNSLDKTLDSAKSVSLAGDKINEILQNTEREFFEIKDYKNAKNFLELTEFEQKVAPLYINARA